MRRPTYVKQRRRLDASVRFERRTNAKDEFNQLLPDAWATLFTTRCAVYPAPGFEQYENAQKAATAPIMIEVRSEVRTRGLLAKDRAVIEGITYNIAAPREQMERGSNIRIIAAVDE